MLRRSILDNSGRGVMQLDAGATLASVHVSGKLTYCDTFNWYSCCRLGTKISIRIDCSCNLRDSFSY